MGSKRNSRRLKTRVQMQEDNELLNSKMDSLENVLGSKMDF